MGSSVLVLPLLILELVNGGGADQDFPIVLFGILWLLPLLFILLVTPIVRRLRNYEGGAVQMLPLLPSLGVAMLLAWFWIVLVIDQMPCFLGVPNCD